MSENLVPFASLGVHSDLVERLAEDGITEPTPIQEQSIPVLMEGRDLMGLAQTGTGKTAAYLLPLIQKILAKKDDGQRSKAPAALILAPTRELAHQVATSIRQFSRGMGLRHLVVCGGERYDGQINALRKGIDFLVATPGRFEDLFKRGVIDLGAVEHLVLDEADQMIDLGFYPAIRRICNAITSPHQTIFFSATMPEEMRSLSDEFLNDSVTVRIKNRNITADTVQQKAILVPDAKKRDALVDLLQETGGEQVLVFVATKRHADKISSFLHAQDFRVDVLHGDIRQHIRTKVLKKFKAGSIQVLVATDVAARGIDVTGLNWVINFDLPQIPEVYVHRIGRTGRAQQKGMAISLCVPSQVKLLHAISRHTKGVFDVFNADGEQVSIEQTRPGRGAKTPGSRTPGSRSSGSRTPGSRTPGSRTPGSRNAKPFNKRKPRVHQGGASNKPHRPILEADRPPEEKSSEGRKPPRQNGPNRKAGHRSEDSRPGKKTRFGQSPSRKPHTKSASGKPSGRKPGFGKPASGKPAAERSSGNKPLRRKKAAG